jgi:hypothetical protein
VFTSLDFPVTLRVFSESRFIQVNTACEMVSSVYIAENGTCPLQQEPVSFHP